MKKIVAAFLSAAMVVSMSACSSAPAASSAAGSASANSTSGSASSAASQGDIVIGCLQDITGATSTLGKMIQGGAQYAIAAINAKGGVNGRKIKMITYDTKASVQEGINDFNRMVNTDKVSAVIGPPVANIGLAIAPISEKYNVPVLGFAINKESEIKSDGTPYKNMFLLQPSSVQQGSIMATYAAKEENLKKIGIIYNQSNAYSVSLVQAFKTASAKLDGVSIVGEVAYQANDKDMKTMLGKLMQNGADAIYAPDYTQELILIAQQAREIGFTKPLICGLDADTPFPQLCGPEANGIICINNIDESDSKIQDIVKDYKTKTGNDATNKFFLGYDTANIIAQIVGQVGDDPVAIQKAAENLKGYQGMTGTITMDPKTHMTTGLEMVIQKIVNQKTQTVKRYSTDA